MTNRENISKTNIADFLVFITKEIAYDCVISILDPPYCALNCRDKESCLQCINDWLNSEVTANVERIKNTESE